MTNLFGPGAFGCARPAASRPTFTPSNLPGDLPDWAQDCSSPLARDGTEWRAAWLNFLIANLRGVVSGSGLPASNLDDAIIARSIQSGGMNFGAATGSANNWTVVLNLALASYRAGTVLWLKAPATNTSPTVTVAIDGLAARPLKKADGSNPAIGDLVGGRFYPTIDDGTNICIVGTLPSDIDARAAANKALQNLQQTANTTRTVYSSIVGATTVFSGSYTKKSATSNLVVWSQLPTFVAGASGPGWIRMTLGGVVRSAPAANNDAAVVKGVCALNAVVSGLAAGAQAWTFELGRSDATSWGITVNPSTTDNSYFPPAGINSTVIIGEVEP